MLLVLLLELDFPPLTGILLTMTEEPLGMRPSSSVYSEADRWESGIKEFIRIFKNQIKRKISYMQGFLGKHLHFSDTPLIIRESNKCV